jgi:hypothetical protein
LPEKVELAVFGRGLDDWPAVPLARLADDSAVKARARVLQWTGPFASGKP